MILGAHESAAGGPYTAVERAVEDGCDAVQLFTKHNKRWDQRMWTEDEAEQFRRAFRESDLRGLMAHSAYLINLCSATARVRDRSVEALADELDRCALLDIPYLVMHPGSPGDRGGDWGIETIADATNHLWERHGDAWEQVTLLFENTAGQGSALGWRMEHLRDIFARLDAPERFGVCFDTCHAHAAGYDLTTESKYAAFWDEFDEVVGLDRLMAFHLNDSKRPLGDRVDRHDQIGEGEIGETTFRLLVNDERFGDHPAVLETPSLEDGSDSFRYNLKKLRGYR